MMTLAQRHKRTAIIIILMAVTIGIGSLPYYYNSVQATVTPEQHDCINHVIMGMISFGVSADKSTAAPYTKAIEICLGGNSTSTNSNSQGENNNPSSSDVTGITQFVVINDNGLYKVRFSLTDQNNALVSSDGLLNFTMYSPQMTGFNQSSGHYDTVFPQLVYHSLDNIKAYQFGNVRLLLTGATLLAYDWQIKKEWVHGYASVAVIHFTLPDGRILRASTDVQRSP